MFKGKYYIHKPLFWVVILTGILLLIATVVVEGIGIVWKAEKVQVSVISKNINNTIYPCSADIDTGNSTFFLQPTVNINCDFINDEELLYPNKTYWYGTPGKTKLVPIFNYGVLICMSIALLINHFHYNSKKFLAGLPEEYDSDE